MNPFADFNHFIAYFVPGIGLLSVVLAFMSLVEGQNFLLGEISFLVILVGSTVAGLFLDEARHVWLEPWLEKDWARRREVDLEELDDFLAYAPKIGIDLYKLLRDEFFYYYEFDINMSFVLILASAILPIYLDRCHIITNHILSIVAAAVLLGMAVCFWVFGRNAYDYFLDAFVSTMERKEPGFKMSIQRR
jgi:hypothetical protein